MRRAGLCLVLGVALLGGGACAGQERGGGRTTIRYSGSAVGAEGEVLSRQIARFERLHPDVRVEVTPTPDAADQRHQLYVQWLNAGAPRPDVLQLDVVWTPELAAAGWILPLDGRGLDEDAFLAPAIAANRWQGHLYGVPLFVDVGMLYWRTDLLDHPPATYAELAAQARRAMRDHGVRYGFVWQGARYEGLVTVFLEEAVGFGGGILGPGGRLLVDSPGSRAALAWLRGAIRSGIVPEAVLGWHEEESRFAFQNGDAVFLRNWPYADPLMADPETSAVAGRFAVAPMPAGPGGQSASALGGAELAINARSRHPDAAWALVDFLTRPAQMIARARIAGEYPPRPALYRSGALDGVLPVPAAEALRIIGTATARPATPVYSELSAALQVELHRSLSGQAAPGPALERAAREIRAVLARLRGPTPEAGGGSRGLLLLGLASAVATLAALAARRLRRSPRPPDGRRDRREERLAWLLVAPAVAAVAGIALAPLVWTAWDSLHAHDLRLPWQGHPFVGLAHYAALGRSARFWEALAHTAVFTALSVSLEVVLGLGLALVLDRVRRGRGAVRAVVLLPWAIPTVVAGLVWRFMFSERGVVNAVLAASGAVPHGPDWLVHATLAWVPLVAADVWKTTPFVALLFLAGLQAIDPALYDAARIDGAGAFQRLVQITVPLLRPVLLVVLVFRTLDAVRVFDLVYVLTGGGPGTATEPIALLAFDTLLRDLRFGRGAALSVVVFAVAFGLALAYVRLLGRDVAGEAR